MRGLRLFSSRLNVTSSVFRNLFIASTFDKDSVAYPPLKKEQISEYEDCFCKKCLKEKYFEKLFPDE